MAVLLEVVVTTRLLLLLLLVAVLRHIDDSSSSNISSSIRGNTKIITTQVVVQAWVPPSSPLSPPSSSSTFQRCHSNAAAAAAAFTAGAAPLRDGRSWRKIPTTTATTITTSTKRTTTTLLATTETTEEKETETETPPPRFHPTFQDLPVSIDEALSTFTSTSETPKHLSFETEKALSLLASTFLALLVGDEEAAMRLVSSSSPSSSSSISKDDDNSRNTSRHRHMNSSKSSLIYDVFRAYDVCDSGTLSREEARRLFIDLARNIVSDLATPSNIREGGGEGSRISSSSNNNNSLDTMMMIDDEIIHVTDDDADADVDVDVVGVGLTSFRPTSNKTAVPAAARANAQRVLRGEEVKVEVKENNGAERHKTESIGGSRKNDRTYDGKDRHNSINKSRDSNTIERIASKLLLMADTDLDGRVSLVDLATLFETIYGATTTSDLKGSDKGCDGDDDDNTLKRKKKVVKTFPQPLMALAGSLQLVPAVAGERRDVIDAALPPDAKWNVGVPGDDHTLRKVVIDEGKLSIVGIGRSADASSYFLPELGIVLDAGLNVKSLRPRTVLLSHGHRDHISALPQHAASKAKIFCPQPIESLVKRFLLTEAQLNYGDESQTDEETIAALGPYDINGVTDGDQLLLPRDAYQGSPTPIGVEVFNAPHKEGIPAVSYGLYRVKNRLKAEYSSLPKAEIGKLIRQDKDVQLTETYHEGVLFYTGDTTIRLLKERWEEILTKYSYVIHEVTFLGRPSTELDASSAAKGHTHYAQLHPWICAFPQTTFILVHWSLRYSRQEILGFFEEEYGGVPENVVLWI